MSTTPVKGAAPWIAFAVCCSIWGSTFLFIRMGNDTMPPVWAATVRLALAAVMFALITLVLRRPWPRGAQLEAAVWFGVVDFGVSLPLLYWGEQKVPSGIAAVLYATIPLTTALFARLFGLEPLRPRIVIASIVAILGVWLLFSSSLGGTLDPVRLVAVFAAATTAGLAGVLLKRAPGADPFATNAWGHGIGAVMCFVASLLLREPQVMPQGEAWISLGYLTIVGSLGAFATFAWLITHWPITRISFVSVIVPVVALVLGMLVLHERPGSTALLGSCVILGAVITGIVGDQQARNRDSAAAERG
ncbi:MAG: EamA family transporter [Candidatus Eisenbacteria bacterium]|nr:EamA family transporter [Candidatus Eisenbacteria bacterium]